MKKIILFILTIFFLCFNFKNNVKETYINSNLDDLILIFSTIKNYVIMRQPDNFPFISQGSDIDILTNELENNFRKVNNLNLKYFTKKKSFQNNNIKQIDLYLNDNFFVKLDFTNLVIQPDTNFSLHRELTDNIIKNKKKKIKNNVEFYIPNKIDDVAIRYCEYKAKNKKKHLDYCNSQKVLFNKINRDIKNFNINYNNMGKQEIYKFNFFLVWNHGIKYITEILDIISENKDIEITFIKKINIKNLDELIDNIYKYDTENNIHIQNKTKYLKQYQGDIIIILCLNKNYKEKHNEKATFCQNINDIKWDIRKKFNPRHTDKNFFITSNLPKGITHNHVIHANDTEEEVFHIFNYFKLNEPFYYIKNSCVTEEVNGDYHLNDFINYEIKNVNINDIRCNIVGKTNLRIEETPHFKFCMNKEKEYINYFNNNIGVNLTQNHTPNRFKGLLKKFDYQNYNNNKYYLIIVNKNYIIQDGLHRISILKSKGIQNIVVIMK